MKLKKIIIFFVILSYTLNITAYASVLGDEKKSWFKEMGANTIFKNTVFLSPTVGEQNESYIEYIPNEMAKPIVVNGWSVWGSKNINNAVSYMYDNGQRPIAGINADFFSFKTGIPMGNVIIDGEIFSDGNEGQDAVAFRNDGTAFIDWLDIKTTVSDGFTSVDIDCINKWYQKGYDPIFMFTEQFGASTHTESECIFIVCSPLSGKLAIGETLELKVEESFVYEGDVKIPEDKVVLLMQTNGIAECYSFMAGLQIGQTITVTNNVYDNDNVKWKDVDQLVSSVGGRMIIDGTVQDVTDNQAAPRTAVGVREDGSAIFYTLDGRQSGYSYGAQIQTVAKRLLELGCKDAINLDGGGSTTIGAVFPGSDEFSVVNRPSDGKPRSVANFLFIRDDRERTDVPWIINVSEENNNYNYLSGASTVLRVDSVYDTANYKMKEPDIKYSVKNTDNSTSDVSGETVYFNGNGDVDVTISAGDAVWEKKYSVYDTPDSIKIYNYEDWKEIDAIYTEANEELQLDLTAAAFVGEKELNGSDVLFEWRVEGEIGSITDDGIFTLADAVNKQGKILVTAGGYTKEIPVKIAGYPEYNPFADTEYHWAKDIITNMSEKGIINGVNENGTMFFYPDKNMTRAEFSKIVCAYMGINPDEYSEYDLIFKDADKIQPWAINYIKAVYENDIILGRAVGDGIEFAPEDKISRAEAMTVLGRITHSKRSGDLEFKDASQIPEWAVDGVKKLYYMGIVNGYEDNTIRPGENVKRCEAITMIYKLTE